MNVRWNHDDETDDWIIIRAFDWFFSLWNPADERRSVCLSS
jgi:hypothetical protein